MPPKARFYEGQEFCNWLLSLFFDNHANQHRETLYTKCGIKMAFDKMMANDTTSRLEKDPQLEMLAYSTARVVPATTTRAAS